MKIPDIYKKKKTVVSFEIFPPKKHDSIDKIHSAIKQLVLLSPDFISVTYGAGGGTATSHTTEIASAVQSQYNIPALAHLTCIGAAKEKIDDLLDCMEQKNIANILALRGDLPDASSQNSDYLYASSLIAHIKKRKNFCIGAACYPEGHIDCDDLRIDIEHLKHKQDSGADFFISQLFFDNNFFFRFLERAYKANITIPISAGIMPIMSRSQIERMIFMCGSSLPSSIIKLLHKYETDPSGLYSAGIEHASKQIEELIKNGVQGVHLYTMNKTDAAKYCIEHLYSGPK